ncbi:LysE family translocator [Pseudoalteromonas sp. MMG013]|uniref:LysE family translocator n=1 Tax=Pseudoalteromonas sp. MMG013 TaxID=2822687 RepID=UPI001B3921F9|nr:LysE family translocator [Pseudoalteromonas sp. MMG013]MBQ4860560.1 LysE family translocator [Pseudoalteromonas sp. MMG013]
MESIISLVLTTALLLGSPGPAPLALAGVGASFGFKRGMGFLSGILCGLLVVIIAVACGLGTLFMAYPTARLFCQTVGIAYLCYVAYKIASAQGGISGLHGPAPSFKDGFILNLINPKAYAAFLAIFANNILVLEDPFVSVIATGVVCFVVAVIVDGLWMAIGGSLRPFFSKPVQAKWLRWTFSAALLASIIITAIQ